MGGEVTLNGRNLLDLREAEMIQIRGAEISMILKAEQLWEGGGSPPELDAPVT